MERPPRKCAEAAGLLILMVFMAVAVWMAHRPVLRSQSLSFDEKMYLAENFLVQRPSWQSAGRFLGEVSRPSTVEGYYQPLNMISLMLDYHFGGRVDDLQPFHRTSLGIHVLNALLIAVFLYQLFGTPVVAALLALAFALHPMTVETIAPVGERKTLLTTFFALCCLLAYVRYARRPAWPVYILGLALYVLALMSKPTSTALPLGMLLMDYWPLRRLNRRSLLEKIPFLLVGAVFAVITVVSQRNTANVIMPQQYPLSQIPLMISHNLVFYLGKIIYPAHLSSFYAYPAPFNLSNPTVLAGVVGTVLLVGILAISWRWTRAWVAGGLFFFIIILPTMNIIGFTQTIASDKFVYLPAVGLLMPLAGALVWLWHRARRPAAAVAVRAAIVVFFLVLAALQTRAVRNYLVHWTNTETHLRYMLSRAPNSYLLQGSLGEYLDDQGRLNEARQAYQKTLELNPDYHLARLNLANLLKQQGALDEALDQYRLLLEKRPHFADAYNNLAIVLAQKGRIDEAIASLNVAINLKPNSPDAQNNLGRLLESKGQLEEAVKRYRLALEQRPDFILAYRNLIRALLTSNKIEEALAASREGIRDNPQNAQLHYLQAVILLYQNKTDQAIAALRQALQINPQYKEAQDMLKALLDQGSAPA